jgi:hypothetical protein
MYARSKPEGDSAGSAAEKAGWSVWNLATSRDAIFLQTAAFHLGFFV